MVLGLDRRLDIRILSVCVTNMFRLTGGLKAGSRDHVQPSLPNFIKDHYTPLLPSLGKTGIGGLLMMAEATQAGSWEKGLNASLPVFSFYRWGN